jgi:hypothetical protein
VSRRSILCRHMPPWLPWNFVVLRWRVSQDLIRPASGRGVHTHCSEGSRSHGQSWLPLDLLQVSLMRSEDGRQVLHPRVEFALPILEPLDLFAGRKLLLEQVGRRRPNCLNRRPAVAPTNSATEDELALDPATLLDSLQPPKRTSALTRPTFPRSFSNPSISATSRMVRRLDGISSSCGSGHTRSAMESGELRRRRPTQSLRSVCRRTCRRTVPHRGRGNRRPRTR